MKIDFKKLGLRILPIAAGAALGYAYWYFIGCNTGSCPITSNPYTTTAYGALMGAVFAFPSPKKKEMKDGNN